MQTKALKNAIKALGSAPAATVQKIPIEDCALMLHSLPDQAALTELRRLLAKRLSEWLTPKQTAQGNIRHVFSALCALWSFNRALVTGDHLVAAIEQLVRSEAAVGGPYYANGTLCVATNTYIAAFVRLAARPLPNVEDFLAQSAARAHGTSPNITRLGVRLLYAQAGYGHFFDDFALKKPGQTPLQILLAPDTSTNGLSHITATQRPDGFWPGEPILTPGKRSRLVTTAVIAGQLARIAHKPAVMPATLTRKHLAIARAAKQMFSLHTEPLRSSALAIIDHMCASDANREITLLPHYFAKALKHPATLNNQQYKILGLASLYGWVAYTIYDDFLDNEGNPSHLPIANIAMRASLDCFRQALPGKTNFQRYVARAFTNMDQANAWEVDQCRFTVQANVIIITKLPRYGSGWALAQRSFAHALAPMAILAQCPHSSYNQARSVESAFRHYLIARQLNDDLHDRLKDIAAGQASYVATAILRHMHTKPGTYALNQLLPAMQRCFRQKTTPVICRRILQHVSQSREQFIKSQLLRSPNTLYQLLDDLEANVHTSLDNWQKAQAFYKRGT